MATVDFVVAFFAGSPLLAKALTRLARPIRLLTPFVEGRKYVEYVASQGGSVLGMFDRVKKPGDTLGRVAVMGFSEGCQGVAAMLKTPDASKIDAMFACDGIHAMYVGGQKGFISPAGLAHYIAFARMALAVPPSKGQGKLAVITHSSIRPPYASTTETAQLIWTEALRATPPEIETAGCGWGCPAALHEKHLQELRWPNAELPLGTKLPAATITAEGWSSVRPSAPETNFATKKTFSWHGFADGWTLRRSANGVYVFGWSHPGTKDPTGNRDHVFQAQMVLPAVVNEMLVSRWNPSCGVQGAESCPIGGEGYHEGGPPTPLANPYPLGIALPQVVKPCVPAHGQIVRGGQDDPCGGSSDVPAGPPAVPSAAPPTPAPGGGSRPSLAGPLLFGVMGVAAGYGAVRWATRKRE